MKDKRQIWLDKAIAKHGNKFNYDNTDFKSMHKHVEIMCPLHGKFKQTPYKHLISKNGCPKCGIEAMRASKRGTKESFIEKAIAKHGNKYLYDNVKYVDDKSKVDVTCPKHGDFSIRPSSHTSGNGCSKCGKESTDLKNTKTTEEFIKESKAKHGDKFDYSVTEYTGAFNKIKIICPIHGTQLMYPNSHLNSTTGCTKCGQELNRLNQTPTKEDFIKKSRLVHGNKYNYDKVNYINNK